MTALFKPDILLLPTAVKDVYCALSEEKPRTKSEIEEFLLRTLHKEQLYYQIGNDTYDEVQLKSVQELT